MMRILNRTSAVILASILLLTGCTGSGSSQELGDLKGDKSGADESSEEAELLEKINLGEIDSYYSMVCSSVAYQLQDAGFTTASGAAKSMGSSDYSAVGVYYYNDDLKFWDDESCQAVGFVEVVNDISAFRDVSNEKYVISVADTNDSDSGIQRICTYNYEDIGSQHLVYDNKYITYYQQSPMRVVYWVQDNKEENYDLELGSLFNYDTKEYIYDESIFEDEYVTHSGVPLTEEIDYNALEAELKKISEQQETNGYTVESYEIAYISPENLQAYIDSQEEDTFFGQPVSELTKAFGEGNALVWENGELHKASLMNNSGDDDYQWSDGLKKCGIGAGALLFSAVVRGKGVPLAIAIDFLVVLAEPVSEGLIAGVYELVVDTASNIENGASVEEAIQLAAPHAFKTFSDKFTITAAKVAVKNTVGIYDPTTSNILVRIKAKYKFKNPEFKEGIKIIVTHTNIYNTTVSTANAALKKIDPSLDILILQNSINNTKKSFYNQVITTSKGAFDYITITTDKAADKAITVLLMPWTQTET